MNYIIIDKQDNYYSEEEGGRFSSGALHEKTFNSYVYALAYLCVNCIKGRIIEHNKHWTYKCRFIFDSSNGKV